MNKVVKVIGIATITTIAIVWIIKKISKSVNEFESEDNSLNNSDKD